MKFILTSGLGIGAPTATVSAMSMWLEREHGVSLAAARESRLVFHEHAEARLALVESEG